MSDLRVVPDDGDRPRSRRPADVRTWLRGRPTLDAMRAEFPHEWTQVEAELNAVVDQGDPKALEDYVQQLASGSSAAPRRGASAKPTRSGLDAALAAEIRRHMAAESVRNLGVRAATGVASGRVRFGKFNGTILQKLLFDGKGLVRKPVSMGAFRVIWPIAWQRQRLMALVEPKGIYCFYSKPLIRELAAIIGDRKAVEIAAGDGTLTRFLLLAGVRDIAATDDHSWSAVAFPEGVEKLDAKAALKAHAPQVVICSWPPDGNDFELAVFRTPSVETYVVIGSGGRVGAGNRAAYAKAAELGFQEQDGAGLSKLVLPPELNSVVRVFERTPSSS